MLFKADVKRMQSASLLPRPLPPLCRSSASSPSAVPSSSLPAPPLYSVQADEFWRDEQLRMPLFWTQQRLDSHKSFDEAQRKEIHADLELFDRLRAKQFSREGKGAESSAVATSTCLSAAEWLAVTSAQKRLQTANPFESDSGRLGLVSLLIKTVTLDTKDDDMNDLGVIERSGLRKAKERMAVWIQTPEVTAARLARYSNDDEYRSFCADREAISKRRSDIQQRALSAPRDPCVAYREELSSHFKAQFDAGEWKQHIAAEVPIDFSSDQSWFAALECTDKCPILILKGESRRRGLCCFCHRSIFRHLFPADQPEFDFDWSRPIETAPCDQPAAASVLSVAPRSLVRRAWRHRPRWAPKRFNRPRPDSIEVKQKMSILREKVRVEEKKQDDALGKGRNDVRCAKCHTAGPADEVSKYKDGEVYCRVCKRAFRDSNDSDRPLPPLFDDMAYVFGDVPEGQYDNHTARVYKAGHDIIVPAVPRQRYNANSEFDNPLNAWPLGPPVSLLTTTDTKVDSKLPSSSYVAVLPDVSPNAILNTVVNRNTAMLNWWNDFNKKYATGGDAEGVATEIAIRWEAALRTLVEQVTRTVIHAVATEPQQPAPRHASSASSLIALPPRRKFRSFLGGPNPIEHLLELYALTGDIDHLNDAVALTVQSPTPTTASSSSSSSSSPVSASSTPDKTTLFDLANALQKNWDEMASEKKGGHVSKSTSDVKSNIGGRGLFLDFRDSATLSKLKQAAYCVSNLLINAAVRLQMERMPELFPKRIRGPLKSKVQRTKPNPEFGNVAVERTAGGSLRFTVPPLRIPETKEESRARWKRKSPLTKREAASKFLPISWSHGSNAQERAFGHRFTCPAIYLTLFYGCGIAVPPFRFAACLSHAGVFTHGGGIVDEPGAIFLMHRIRAQADELRACWRRDPDGRASEFGDKMALTPLTGGIMAPTSDPFDCSSSRLHCLGYLSWWHCATMFSFRAEMTELDNQIAQGQSKRSSERTLARLRAWFYETYGVAFIDAVVDRALFQCPAWRFGTAGAPTHTEAAWIATAIRRALGWLESIDLPTPRPPSTVLAEWSECPMPTVKKLVGEEFFGRLKKHLMDIVFGWKLPQDQYMSALGRDSVFLLRSMRIFGALLSRIAPDYTAAQTGLTFTAIEPWVYEPTDGIANNETAEKEIAGHLAKPRGETQLALLTNVLSVSARLIETQISAPHNPRRKRRRMHMFSLPPHVKFIQRRVPSGIWARWKTGRFISAFWAASHLGPMYLNQLQAHRDQGAPWSESDIRAVFELLDTVTDLPMRSLVERDWIQPRYRSASSSSSSSSSASSSVCESLDHDTESLHDAEPEWDSAT